MGSHLKSLVDTYPNIKCVGSGSAAAALRLKSSESGAGRFTDFLLPPLTFYEYLHLRGKTERLITGREETGMFLAENINEVNKEFIFYLNFGGYPEVMFSHEIQADPARFIKSDIIDKVLLRDLPSLYGIGDIQELNYLFTPSTRQQRFHLASYRKILVWQRIRSSATSSTSKPLF